MDHFCSLASKGDTRKMLQSNGCRAGVTETIEGKVRARRKNAFSGAAIDYTYPQKLDHELR